MGPEGEPDRRAHSHGSGADAGGAGPADPVPPEAGRLLDVGTGNGSPGLVLAVLREDLEVTLVEPRTRRWAFLREAVRHCGSPPVQVFRGRHDEFPGPPARTVTLRALALPLMALAPLVEPGGQVVFLGGSPVLDGPFEEQDAKEDARVFRRLPDDVSRGTSGTPDPR